MACNGLTYVYSAFNLVLVLALVVLLLHLLPVIIILAVQKLAGSASEPDTPKVSCSNIGLPHFQNYMKCICNILSNATKRLIGTKRISASIYQLFAEDQNAN